MTRRSIIIRFGFLAIGVSLVVMVLSMTPLVGNPRTRIILLGSGAMVLSSSLILLQLRFFREGDARKSSDARRRVQPGEVKAPPGIRNPRLRTIWSNMEGTRRLMKQKEEEALREERLCEKKRLGLPEKEEIVYMGNRSWFHLWPVALISFIFIAASTTLTGIQSLLCLTAGLTGLGVLAALNRMTRYYITNLRILVRRRLPLAGKPSWRAIHYTDIQRCVMERKFARDRLRLAAKDRAIDIMGLSRTELEAVSRVIRDKIPQGIDDSRQL